MNIKYGDKKLERIWQDFHDGKIHKNPGIRNEIFESWLRSRKFGVDPYSQKAPLVLDELSLAEELERKRELLLVANPVIQDIYSVIKGSSSGVWLCNEKGIIIKVVADSDIRDMCEQRDFRLGADWSEDKVGTNAMGTALYLKRPIQCVRSEHYRKAVSIGYCSSAPIFSPNGEIIGVLDVTGFWEEHNPHTLGLVVAGAGSIQRELQLQNAHQKLSLSHQYILEMIESLPSGIIIVNEDGIIIGINNNACEMLKTSSETFLNKKAEQVFGTFNGLKKILEMDSEFEETEYYTEKGNQKLHFTLIARPIKYRNGSLDGIVVVLREIDAVRRITGKMAGFQAKFTFEDIISEDPRVITIVKRAETVATTSSNIIILGESGTGKEILAQAIHNASRRSNGPFVAINCGVLPRELVGSELFGYDEGAFTGAKRGGKPGKFELANHGTLFLDEIGDMPLDLQLALLRVLQEKVVVRLGGQKELSIDVRIIAATNKDLQQMMEKGLFREDLYYRLSVVVLKLPPLKQRREDVAILAKYFLQKKSKKIGKEVYSIDPYALEILNQYSWPGNIRELENVIERAIIFSNGPVIKGDCIDIPIEEKTDTPINLPVKNEQVPSYSLKSGEKAKIEYALNKCEGNITQASRMLGITRKTLYKKLRKYEIR